jgi:hypothetical protein
MASEKWYRGWIALGGECRVMVSAGSMPSVLAADPAEFPDRAADPKSFNWGVPSRATYILARTLLVDALGREAADRLDTAQFMAEVLVHFAKGPDWQLNAGEIARWAENAMARPR